MAGTIVAVLAVVASIAAVVANQQRERAQAQARLALSRQLDVAANRLVDDQPDLAILVGLQSLSLSLSLRLRRDQRPKPQPSAALANGLARVTHASRLITGHTDAVRGVAFSPDGKSLATASQDRTVRLWDPNFTAWLASGCKLVNRNLSMPEWNQHIPDLPYQRTCPDLPPGQNAPRDAPAARYYW